MRTVSGGEATLLTQGHVNHYVRVYVKNASGTEKLLTSLGGTDWVDSVSWDGESVDRQIATATVRLKRDITGGTSLAPLIAGSSLNVDDASAYAPLLDVGRALRITTAVTDAGVAPASGDWKEVFNGRIDSVDWEGDPITVQCSDLSAWLMDTAIQTPTNYGSDSGATVESILQAILNDWPPFAGSPVTLYELNSSGVAVAVGSGGALSPSWTIPFHFMQQPMPVLEALNNIVAQFGWTLRYHYDTAGAYQFTLYQPPRGTTTSLATIGTSTYREVRKCATAIADVRNTFALIYYDGTNTPRLTTDSDSGSVAEYGTRFMRLAGDSVANIRVGTDAATMLTAIKADLKAPKLDKEVTLLYYWPAQAYDLYTFPANGVHYDSDQKLAVMSVKHEAANGEIVTTLQLRGTVIGAFADWLDKRVVSPLTADPSSSLIGVDWANILDIPTTVAGYGITDVYTKTAADARYLALAGGTMTGTTTVTLGTITTSTPARSDTATWNSGGVTFVADFANITDTASAAGSLLIRRQVNGADVFSVQKNGAMYTNGAAAFLALIGSSAVAGQGMFLAAGSSLRGMRAGGGVTIDAVSTAGTTSAPTATTASQPSTLRFGGYDGSVVAFGALLRGAITETWSPTAHGTGLTFFVTANGTTSNVLALTLDQDKSATFAGAMSGTTATFTGSVIAGTASRAINLGGAAGGAIYISGDSGTWANGLYFKGSGGTARGGFGAYGSADALTYFYIGTDYTTTFAQFTLAAATLSGTLTSADTFLMRTTGTLANGAAAAAGTLTNAPAAGNPTKWLKVDDNGTTRYVPAW